MADNTKTLKMWQSAVSSTEDCLPLQVLERMMESTSADQKAAAHLLGCPHCQTELAMLKTFESSIPSDSEGAAVGWIAAQLQRQQNKQAMKPVVAGFSFWRAMFKVPYMAGAAALAVILALGISLHNSGNQEGPAKVGHGIYNHGNFRTGAIRLLSPAGDQAQAPVEFRWEAFSGASSYAIELKDTMGTVLVNAKSKRNVFAVTPEMDEQMPSGKSLKWKVTAFDASGKEIANSTGGDFKINKNN
jgi:hypothetical protein